jgi:4-hydroxybenzoate polyprenyltransferase
MRDSSQWIWLILAVLVAAGVLGSWLLSAETGFAWWRVAGLGLSVIFLALIWLWPGIKQPKRPPL